jgi:hypothetical protein
MSPLPPWVRRSWPLLALVAGCFASTSEVTMLRPQLPALPPDCPVNILATTTSPYPIEDLVELTVVYAPGGHEPAMNRLREQACYYAGDTLYAITETPRGNASTTVKARVARRPPGASAPPAPTGTMPPVTSTTPRR